MLSITTTPPTPTFDHAEPSPARWRPPAGAATPSPLAPFTRREREVVALLLSGRSNRQIADALAIGERTAEAHVANILGKLGLNSRARVVVWAAAHGLTVDQPSPLAGVG
jgi:DNA-binding CsgD family transcriptional regulator